MAGDLIDRIIRPVAPPRSPDRTHYGRVCDLRAGAQIVPAPGI